MQLNIRHTTLLFALCASLTACGVKEVLDDTPGTKSPIELSVGGVDAPDLATKAVITDGVGKTLKPLDAGTHIYMLMKSDYVSLPSGFENLNFGGDPATKYCVTRGQVVASSDPDKNDVEFTESRKRFWDDAHARSSKLSIWAITCPGCDYLGGTGTNLNDESVKFNTTVGLKDWQTTAINATSIEWNVPHFNAGNFQTAETVKNRDLCFSNNKVNYSPSGSDGRLFYKTPDKKFEGGNLIFYRALSKITVNINIGEGFTGSTDFRFTETSTLKNAQLQYFNIWGRFNVVTGEWTEVNNGHQAIMGMYNVTGVTPNTSDASKPAYQLEALVIPYLSSDSKTIKGSIINEDSNSKAIVFTIDNNKYEVSRAELLEALRAYDGNGVASDATSVELEAGKNYVFTFTVSKVKIKNITAQVVDWENVVADNQEKTSARIKLQLEERGTAQTSDVAFYKAEDNNTGAIDDNYATYKWKTGYTNLGATYDTDHWTTNCFWGSNKDFYHFRALMPDETTVTTDSSGDGDYVALTSAASYTDVRWGAPMKDDGNNETAGSFKWTYDPVSKGFDTDGHTQIYKAIGPTEDPVKLILFHMMSDLTINIKTTTGSDAVNLGDGSASKTKVELVNYKTGGKVLLGNGLVKATGDATTAEIGQNSFTAAVADPPTSAIAKYVYGAIPQDLANVKLYITTPDNNQYIVDLKDVTATSVTSNNIANPYTQVDGSSPARYTINRWYPGFKYTYSFKLKKTGIENITATVVDWEEVVSDEGEITIR